MNRSRTNPKAAGELLLELRRDRREPLHRQIEAWIRDAIRTGRLRQGMTLPPTRTLAGDLGVSRGVVVEAYQQLVAEGYLTSQTGGYTPVAIEPRPMTTAAPVTVSKRVRIAFRYGRADVSNFPRAAWLRSIRRVVTEAPSDRFGYLSGRGVPELREALSGYLDRVRGTDADADNVVISSGYGQGIALVLQALRE